MSSESLTITSAQLSRLYLIKHHLFQKANKNKILKVVDDMCGLHAQLPTTPYISLWNRVEDFEHNILDKALYRNKTCVKLWCMRGTLHVIPSKDLPVYSNALRRMWLERHEPRNHAPGWPSIEDRKKRIYPRILDALVSKPLTRNELSATVRSSLNDESIPFESLFSAWGGILKETTYQGLTVHAQPCHRESCFARLDKWLPHVNLNKIDEKKAIEQLLIEYLRGYGPASTQDFSFWSGLNTSDFKDAIEKNVSSSLLEEVKVQGSKGRLFLLKEDRQMLESMDLDEKAPARLLPKFDSFVLGHKDRARIIKLEHLKKVYRPKIGDVAATLLINGQITGTWKHEKTKATLRITITPFTKVQKENLEEVEEEAKALSQFMGFDQTEFCISEY